MLDVFGGHYATCDGVTRRGVLRVGALGLAGLTLGDFLRLRARASAPPRPQGTAVIQVFLGGGPSQFETFDPKPDAPKEFRGEFAAIPTRLPGVQVSELLPNLAGVLDRVALVRSLHHDTADHFSGSHWIMTGFPSAQQLARTNDRPSVGSIVARLRGPNGPGVPPYIGLPGAPAFGQAAYLGAGYNPFAVEGDFANGKARVRDLDVAGGLSAARLDDRRYLLTQLDRLDRERDRSGTMEGLDQFTARAYEMITGPAARRAFDLGREDPRLRDRYGRTRVGQACLLARRLVEAGVTFVTLTEGNWDHHAQVAANCRRQLPAVDQAVATLIGDLVARGLADRVLVVVWGEFGRTPRINGNGGRDHWPSSMSALVAGGGLRMGQVIGATDRKGERPTDRACRPEDLLQTVYQVLGIDPNHEFPNEAGRPLAVLNVGRPIAELVG